MGMGKAIRRAPQDSPSVPGSEQVVPTEGRSAPIPHPDAPMRFACWLLPAALLSVLMLLATADAQAQIPGLNPTPTATPAATPAPPPDTVESLAEAAAAWREHAARFDELLATAPQRIEALRAEMAELDASAPPSPPSGATAEELQALLADAERREAEALRALREAEAEPDRRSARRAEIRERLAALRPRLAEAPAEGADPAIHQARMEARQAEVEALEKELASYEGRSALLPLRRDAAARRHQRAAQEAVLLREALQQARQAEAARAAQEARERLAQADPRLQRLAERNLELARRRAGEDGLVAMGRAAEDLLERRERELDALEDRAALVRSKVDAIGLTPGIGALLQEEAAALPSPRQIRRAMAERADALPGLQLDLLRWRRERNHLADDFDGAVAREVADAGGEVEQEAAKLLRNRLVLYDELIADADFALGAMIDLDLVESQLLRLATEYNAFIRERVLWVRNRSPLSRESLAAAGDVARWLVSPSAWGEAARGLPVLVGRSPGAWLLAVLAIGGLMEGRRRLRRAKAGILADSHPSASQALRATMVAAGLALGIPAAAWIAGWLLARDPASPQMLYALGLGLQSMAFVAAPLEFFRQIAAREGVAERAFRWPRYAAERLRSATGRLECVLLPIAAVGYGLAASPGGRAWVDAAGPLMLIVGQAALALYMWRTLDPARGPARYIAPKPSRRWNDQLRLLWRPLLAAAPLALVAIGLAGYTNAALPLSTRFVQSLLLVGMVLLLWRVLNLWAAEQAAKLEERKAGDAKPLSPVDHPSGEYSVDIDALDAGSMGLDAIRAQVGRLIRGGAAAALLVGLWMIWSPVLPAVGILSNVELWRTAPQVVERTVAADGTETTRMLGGDGIVTLADLLLALLAVAATIAAARNIPGLFEVVLLERLPLEAGTRFAISTVSRYAIVLVGMVVAFGLIDIGWSKVQWLAAAVTVGLSFGLQEIFSNFISGLIILFERPIRIGDLVTVGETSGRVTQIRMRATVITDFEERELLVPNKEFVTGRVVNWTLTNPMTRGTIEIGVEYGSDTEKAKAILLDLARRNEDILATPEPRALFVGFGASALTIRFLFYLPRRDVFLKTVDWLHTEIDKAYKEAGITIAFPQMDLHLRSWEPSLELLSRDGRDRVAVQGPDRGPTPEGDAQPADPK